MSEWIKTLPENEVEARPSAVLLDIIVLLAKYKRLIIGLPLVFALLAAAITFAMDPSYSSTTKLLPPQQAQSSASALLSQLGGVASIAAGVGGLKNPNDLYVGMLKSRTVADALIAKFDLKQRYETESLERARKRLAEKTAITSGKDGLITIQVEDSDPANAAKIANTYVDELLRLTRVLAVTEASQRRLFFERQLELAKDNLANAEVTLKGALDSRGVISVDAESKAIVETLARLKAQISAKDIQLNSMKAFVTPANPEYQKVAEELASLRSELSKLENGRGASTVSATSGGFENIKLLRDLKYYQMLYELLAKQYEVARLDEAKDPSIIQVLDAAVVAEHPIKPRRLLIVVTASLVGFIVAIFFAFANEAKMRAISAPGGSEKWSLFKSYMSFK